MGECALHCVEITEWMVERVSKLDIPDGNVKKLAIALPLKRQAWSECNGGV